MEQRFGDWNCEDKNLKVGLDKTGKLCCYKKGSPELNKEVVLERLDRIKDKREQWDTFLVLRYFKIINQKDLAAIGMLLAPPPDTDEKVPDGRDVQNMLGKRKGVTTSGELVWWQDKIPERNVSAHAKMHPDYLRRERRREDWEKKRKINRQADIRALREGKLKPLQGDLRTDDLKERFIGPLSDVVRRELKAEPESQGPGLVTQRLRLSQGYDQDEEKGLKQLENAKAWTDEKDFKGQEKYILGRNVERMVRRKPMIDALTRGGGRPPSDIRSEDKNLELALESAEEFEPVAPSLGPILPAQKPVLPDEVGVPDDVLIDRRRRQMERDKGQVRSDFVQHRGMDPFDIERIQREKDLDDQLLEEKRKVEEENRLREERERQVKRLTGRTLESAKKERSRRSGRSRTSAIPRLRFAKKEDMGRDRDRKERIRDFKLGKRPTEMTHYVSERRYGDKYNTYGMIYQDDPGAFLHRDSPERPKSAMASMGEADRREIEKSRRRHERNMIMEYVRLEDVVAKARGFNSKGARTPGEELKFQRIMQRVARGKEPVYPPKPEPQIKQKEFKELSSYAESEYQQTQKQIQERKEFDKANEMMDEMIEAGAEQDIKDYDQQSEYSVVSGEMVPETMSEVKYGTDYIREKRNLDLYLGKVDGQKQINEYEVDTMEGLQNEIENFLNKKLRRLEGEDALMNTREKDNIRERVKFIMEEKGLMDHDKEKKLYEIRDKLLVQITKTRPGELKENNLQRMLKEVEDIIRRRDWRVDYPKTPLSSTDIEDRLQKTAEIIVKKELEHAIRTGEVKTPTREKLIGARNQINRFMEGTKPGSSTEHKLMSILKDIESKLIQYGGTSDRSDKEERKTTIRWAEDLVRDQVEQDKVKNVVEQAKAEEEKQKTIDQFYSTPYNLGEDVARKIEHPSWDLSSPRIMNKEEEDEEKKIILESEPLPDVDLGEEIMKRIEHVSEDLDLKQQMEVTPPDVKKIKAALPSNIKELHAESKQRKKREKEERKEIEETPIKPWKRKLAKPEYNRLRPGTLHSIIKWEKQGGRPLENIIGDNYKIEISSDMELIPPKEVLFDGDANEFHTVFY